MCGTSRDLAPFGQPWSSVVFCQVLGSRISFFPTVILLKLSIRKILWNQKSTNFVEFSNWHKLFLLWKHKLLSPFYNYQINEEHMSYTYPRVFSKSCFIWKNMISKVPECCCMWSNLLSQLILHKNSEPSLTSSVVMWTASLPLRNTLVTGVSPIFQKVLKILNA